MGIASVTIETSPNGIVWETYKTITCSGNNKTETVSDVYSLENHEEGVLYIRGIAEDTVGNQSNSDNDAPYVQYMIDFTAPVIPKDFKADAITGEIELSWTQGEEKDLDDYILYRSEDGEEYTVLKEGLYSINFWDRDVEKDIQYSYKLAVRDQAGNISECTEVVQAVLPEDTIAPEIKSIAPENNSTVGVSNDMFQILVSDNWKINNVSVFYTINDNTEINTLFEETDINSYYTSG